MNKNVKLNLGFILASIMIIVISLISIVCIKMYERETYESLEALELQKDLEKVSTQYLMAKSGARGYHISPQEFLLEEFWNSKKELFLSLGRLKVAFADSPAQLQETLALEKALTDRFNHWEANFDSRREQGISFSQNLSKDISWKNFEERIYSSLENLKNRESLSVRESVKDLAAFNNFTMIFVIFGSIFAIGLIVAAIFVIHRDLKLRQKAEEELKTFFDVSLDMLSISGMDGYFRLMSPVWSDVLGYTTEELMKIPLLDHVHPDDLPKTFAEIERQKNGAKIFQFENRWKTKYGSYVDLSWKSVPVGNLMYGVARDITMHKVFEKELMDAQKEAHAAAKVKTEFLANMSHEIRTPLNGIIGVTDLLDGTTLTSEQKRYTTTIRSSGTILLKIINEILDFSKIEAGKLELETLDFDIRNFIENQISLMGTKAHEKNLQIHSEIDPSVPTYVKGDSGRIAQILLNLLNNAIKFTDHGGITLGVDLLTKNHTTMMLKFWVKDTGIGMTENQLKRIFTPFNQADGSTARKYGGTGLGLSISKKLSEMMGGEIGVESEADIGSTFWFTIKIGISDVKRNEPVVIHSEIEFRSLRILVAEDNQVNQMIIKKMLEKMGHSVLVVANGIEAVNSYKEASFDLILMDHHMPVMDGVEATIIIRKMEMNQKRIPILAFTANVVEESQKIFKGAGIDDFIMKPVTLNTLEATLKKWMHV